MARLKSDQVEGAVRLRSASNFDGAGELPVGPTLMPTNSIVGERKLHFLSLIVTR